jgi:hypothetical protein
MPRADDVALAPNRIGGTPSGVGALSGIGGAIEESPPPLPPDGVLPCVLGARAVEDAVTAPLSATPVELAEVPVPAAGVAAEAAPELDKDVRQRPGAARWVAAVDAAVT